MGFYGNITNVSRTQFQFDKIYPNRHEMEVGKLTDGVFLGRYVLIEYDSDYHLDTFLRVQMKNDRAYYNPEGATDYSTLLTKGLIKQNELVYTSTSNLTPDTGLSGVECTFYKCTSNFIEGSREPATFEVISSLEGPAYTDNYHIDTTAYGAGRGYDSTVWQKVFTDGVERYVMIAELNTVVPTFSVVAEAPTMNPVVPHFDTESTDVYYKLHWQAPWGFRVAAADEDKSDIATQWTETTYNPATGRNETVTFDPQPAAIYFNKDAFKAFGENGVITRRDDETKDEIKILPVSSGKAIYDDHNPATTNPISAPDIQEMTINLPAIGNMMSDAWDIIHGPLRNDDMREYLTDNEGNRLDEDGNKCIESGKEPFRIDSLQGRLNSIAAIAGDEIPVKRHDNGQLIGSKINGGKADEDDKTGINDDAWIETIVDAATNTISIHHKFNRTKNGNTFTDLREADDWGHNTVDSINMNSTTDNFNIVTPIIDDMGHVVGENTQTITLPYNFKTIKTNGVSTATSNPLVTEDVDIVADNSKADLTVAAGNKWIRMANNPDIDILTIGHEVHAFTTTSNGTTNLNKEEDAIDENNINIPDWDYDEAGHIKSKQDHYYTLPFSFKTITTNGRSAEVSENATGTPVTADIVAENTQDVLTINSGNKWVRIDTNATNDTITIRHDVHNFDTDKADSASLSNETSETVTFDTTTYDFDKAGHFTGKTIKTITVPFGYGKVKGDSGETAATATYDELTFASDEWLTATVTTDKVTYNHDTSNPNKIEYADKDDQYPSFGSTFTIEDWAFDEKGHQFNDNKSHTVTIPNVILNNADSGNVVVGLTLSKATGANDKTATFTESKVNVGNLKLTDYSVVQHTNANGSTDLQPQDTINGAFNKLQTQIYEEEVARANEASRALGVEEALGERIDTLVADVNTNGSIAKSINDAINNLDVNDSAQDGQYVSSVSETDGKIIVTRVSLPTYTLAPGTGNGAVAFNGNDVQVTGLRSAAYTDSAAYDAAGAASTAEQNAKNYADSLANNYATAAQGIKADSALQLDTEFSIPDGDDGAMAVATIPQLFAYIRDLQTQVSNLQIEVNRLSAFHPVEDNITTEE